LYHKSNDSPRDRDTVGTLNRYAPDLTGSERVAARSIELESNREAVVSGTRELRENDSRQEIKSHYSLAVCVYARDLSPDVSTADVTNRNDHIYCSISQAKKNFEFLLKFKPIRAWYFKLQSVSGNVQYSNRLTFVRISEIKADALDVDWFAVMQPLFERDDEMVAATTFSEARTWDIPGGETNFLGFSATLADYRGITSFVEVYLNLLHYSLRRKKNMRRTTFGRLQGNRTGGTSSRITIDNRLEFKFDHSKKLFSNRNDAERLDAPTRPFPHYVDKAEGIGSAASPIHAKYRHIFSLEDFLYSCKDFLNKNRIQRHNQGVVPTAAIRECFPD
jgi:hypothetical protein